MSGFRNALQASAMGSYLYYDYDIPNNIKYNSVFMKQKPLDFDVVLFTEDNFGGWAVPLRKGQDAMLAEQVSSNFKSWAFKSMKMKFGSKLQLKSILPNSSTKSTTSDAIVTGIVDFVNQGYGSVPNINTLIRSNNDIMQSSFGKAFDQSKPGVNYYIQERNV